VALDYLERELARAQRRPAVRGSESQREEYLERSRTLLRICGPDPHAYLREVFSRCRGHGLRC